jgi:hypothetical protein
MIGRNAKREDRTIERRKKLETCLKWPNKKRIKTAK